MDGAESDRLSRDLIRALVQLKRILVHRDMRFGRDMWRRECMHHGMKHSEVMFLFRLIELQDEFPDGISISQMSERMLVRPPSVTSIVTSLEKKGMIERRMDPGDRRIVRIVLTDAGSEFVMSNKNRMLMQVQGLVEYLGADKTAQLCGLLSEAFCYYSRERGSDYSDNGDE